jgi:hypothetical protein
MPIGILRGAMAYVTFHPLRKHPKILKQRCFKEGGEGGEGDLPVVWHFSHGENRLGATSAYIRCCYHIGPLHSIILNFGASEHSGINIS